LSEHAATMTVHFPGVGHARTPAPTTSPGRRLRVARSLAFAHHLDAQIRARVYDDLADAARTLGLTRARLTQTANLTLLAPAIQEEILAMPLIATGRDTISERTLRPIVAEPMWERQVSLWRSLRARCHDERRLGRERAREEDFATALLSEVDDVE
jgi:hypothetical protein